MAGETQPETELLQAALAALQHLRFIEHPAIVASVSELRVIEYPRKPTIYELRMADCACRLLSAAFTAGAGCYADCDEVDDEPEHRT